MKRIVTWFVRAALTLGLLVLTILVVWAFQSRTIADLHVWHTATLPSEFTAGDAASERTLEAYLAREARVFDELEDVLGKQQDAADSFVYSRYRSGGPQDPARWARNWNRTFELIPDTIRGGALLLHGLTDSPYSLRALAEILHANGFYVLGLRLPAHGTIPAALTRVHWEDWVAASRLAARHVRERIGPELRFAMAGYSNGGALTVKYTLDALSDASLPRPDQLLLFSPEIGISPIAGISNWHKLLSFMPYFAKFKWLSIEPEYDPFKYNSFPKNAAQQAHDLTVVLQRQVQEAHEAGRLADFPPVMTFTSRKDATVEVEATVEDLYNKLGNESSELIVFDVNRSHELEAFMPAAQDTPLQRLATRTNLPYRLTAITNVESKSAKLSELTKAPRTSKVDSTNLSLEWPYNVSSLSHVAIPFPPNDPVYGDGNTTTDEGYDGLPLGSLQPRGENRLLTVSVSQLMRLRHNPFFQYIKQRVEMTIYELMART